MEGKPLTDGKAKSLVAYHEVGHAVCGTLTPGHDPVQKVTLIPRGQARGLTWFIPGKDSSGWVKTYNLKAEMGCGTMLKWANLVSMFLC